MRGSYDTSCLNSPTLRLMLQKLPAVEVAIIGIEVYEQIT